MKFKKEIKHTENTELKDKNAFILIDEIISDYRDLFERLAKK